MNECRKNRIDVIVVVWIWNHFFLFGSFCVHSVWFVCWVPFTFFWAIVIYIFIFFIVAQPNGKRGGVEGFIKIYSSELDALFGQRVFHSRATVEVTIFFLHNSNEKPFERCFPSFHHLQFSKINWQTAPLCYFTLARHSWRNPLCLMDFNGISLCALFPRWMRSELETMSNADWLHRKCDLNYKLWIFIRLLIMW